MIRLLGVVLKYPAIMLALIALSAGAWCLGVGFVRLLYHVVVA